MARTAIALAFSAASLVGQAFSLDAQTQAPSPLRVIRALPSGEAPPLTQISVSFDRPVAGSLDRSVAPATVISVEPAIRGKLEWRDPVTIRLVPATPLPPGATYTVTVANSFRAMDGSALAEPYHFTFRVHGPRLLGGTPVGAMNQPTIVPTSQFELYYSAPVDLARLSSAAYIEFLPTCGQRVARLRATSQRPLTAEDRGRLPEGDDSRRPDPQLDSMRRAVHLVSDAPLPRGCLGELVAPNEIEEQGTTRYERWRLAVYGDFRVAGATCDRDFCPRGPLRVTFTTPVKGAELLRRVHLVPDVKFVVRDTAAEETTWTLEGKYEPRVGYAIVVDTAIRDVFGQPLRGNPAAGVRTTGYAPSINHPYGHLLVEREGFRTLSVQHVNIDTLIAVIAPIPDTLESRVFSRFGWANDTVWNELALGATTQRIPLRAQRDKPLLTGVRFPATNARRAGSPTVFAVKITGRTIGRPEGASGPIAIVQVTDLGVHARIGATEGVVWVTGVHDGMARPGASVVLYDTKGRRLATAQTDARGIAQLAGWTVPKDTTRDEYGYEPTEGYVKVTLGDDRAIASINRYDPDLSPWRFNVNSAWGDDRLPVAGAVFTERGIYRPGERVYAKAIVRDGALGALHVPSAGDSIRWRFHGRDAGMLREVTTRLTAFGTSSQSIVLPNIAPIGYYALEVQAKRQGAWRSIARTYYRVAEYRPPEFLVDLRAQSATHYPGDAFSATVQARYLFGAPMGRAIVTWNAGQSTMWPWELAIPGVEGWFIGENGSWWEENDEEPGRVFAEGTDTLDVRGERVLKLTLPEPLKGRAAHISLQATVIDVNRQVVASTETTTVHPADFYIAAKPAGESYFWRAGAPQSIDILTVRPGGQKVSNVRVQGTIVRREWHRVRREREGIAEMVGDWVSDTVASCSVTTAMTASACAFTPREGGLYVVTLAANDVKGRAVKTSFDRWAAGSDWVPWSDETQFKMDVVPDRPRYSVGDTATILFASPFTNAEAWITVEREGLIDQRRVRIASGATTLKFPITEAYAPNAFVSILVARGRSAAPGPLDDPGRPTIRVGYAELRVTPEVKRLAITLASDKQEYRPADTARVRVRVRDAQGRGQRSEVTLWAVDQGVLSLTGYKTPDPIDLIYRERGLGMRLASNMTSVAPQVPDGEKGKREAGGGGGAAGADVLRSRFQTTAFFLATVVTDAQGNAVASAKLPDNLTTFRIMAVAVTAGDRYGKGESSMLVTRPLLARQALPRFVRPGDQFTAGAVVNRRDGAVATVQVRAEATGVELRGGAQRTATLAASRGAEVRFPFQAMRGDSAVFRFDVTGDRPGDADAVRVMLPVRPEYHPLAHTIAGVLRDTATIDVPLPPGIDPARSRLSVSIGSSPIAMVKGIAETIRIYPYYCSEQIVSSAIPLIALYRAQKQGAATITSAGTISDITRAVETLSRRQRTDGAIGYWTGSDWSTPWLSAYAGMVLIEARDVGVKVDTVVLSHLASYVTRSLHDTAQVDEAPLAQWYRRRDVQLRDKVAAVDFLSRFGRPDVAMENELLRVAAMLTIEDRARLGEVFARRGQSDPARQLLASALSVVRVEGRRATIPDSLHTPFYFESGLRPIARLLTATLRIDPHNPIVGPLIETIAIQGRAEQRWYWNTQDLAAAATAFAAVGAQTRGQAERVVHVSGGGSEVMQAGGNASGDSSISLANVVSGGARSARLSVNGGAGEGSIYYYVTLHEVPVTAPVTPLDNGVRVERWYERFQSGAPVTSVAEGDLVRVRLRITVPATRTFLVLDDALPAGLEAVDLSLRTASADPGPGTAMRNEQVDHEEREQDEDRPHWGYGYWDSGWWSPFDHREIRDDRVVYSATILWPGTYTATYIARATTAGTFIRPPAHAEEMYNPGLNGRSDGGVFTVTERKP